MKNTYWLIGPDNTFAQVEGAARRDELAASGWTPAEEPGSADRVWLRHDVTGGVALFPFASLEPWQARGWEFVVPETRNTDQGPMVVLPEPSEQAAPAAAATATAETPAEEPPTTAGEAQSSEKESRRGR